MVEVNNKTRSRIDLVLVKKVAEKFLKYYNIKRRFANMNGDNTNDNNVEVSIGFVGGKTIRGLNKQYRGVDKATDILSFPDQESNFLGEVIINYAQIKKQAKYYSKSVKQELIFILVHGLLHLAGYDDKTETGKQEMEKLGEKFIKFLNYNF